MSAHADGHAQFTDHWGREPRELRFRLCETSPFKLIYLAPEAVSESYVPGALLLNGEILSIAKAFVGVGTTHVHLTIPEIGMREGLVGLIHGLKAVSGAKEVSLTTMGTDLVPHIPALLDAGLDAVNISVDTLRPGRYAKITGTDKLPQALAGMRAAFDAGFKQVRVNVVVMRGVNDDEISDFIEEVKERNAEVRFIELVPFSKAGWVQSATEPWYEVLQNVRARFGVVEDKERTGNGVISYTMPEFPGRICFVPNLSQTFCDTCDRIRVSPDGGVQACRFSHPDMRVTEALRAGATDEELQNEIVAVLDAKPEGRPGLDELRQLGQECRSTVVV